MGWIIALLILLLAVAVNGIAAGVVAVLHAWRVRLPRESRIFIASATAALVPTAITILLALVGSSDTDLMGLPELAIFAGACLAAITLVSLPGAVAVARKLEAPGNEFRAFE
jgi:hypothetical protein